MWKKTGRNAENIFFPKPEYYQVGELQGEGEMENIALKRGIQTCSEEMPP